MDALFTTGHVADLILAAMVLEVVAIVLYRRFGGQAPSIRTLLPNLLAGGALVMALRLALVGASWTWIAIALIAALAAHLWDLAGRWTQRRSDPQ